MTQAAKLPRTSGLFKKTISEKTFCPRQRSCPGQVACSKKSDFRERVLPQAAKLPVTSGLFKKSPISEKKFCPRQRSCPGQVACSKDVGFFIKSSAPGSVNQNPGSRTLDTGSWVPGLGPWAWSRAGPGPARTSYLHGSRSQAWVYKSSVGLEV